MKNLITLLFITALALTSCKKETETKENAIPKVVVPFYQVANQQQNQTLATPQPSQGQSLYPAASAQNTTTQTQTVAAPVKVPKGMNPSHGQPGHRCDIAVGAPLNTAVATSKPTSTQVVAQPNVTVTPSVTSTTPTPKGMNPPHGQPGHRCDIPVGSPLNSPVAADKTVTPQVVPNYIVSPPATNETPTPAVVPPTQ
ncbi:hypothetical protein [Flavobacterium laiguense]|uniref:Uncharacterized protein n=1 Tax=Flavobacterium laiguense TaxID=2169409 RepID=A0A2U1JVK6_9FLAO|nr:hypothetical protein [Flavobacterium laiguense]PWA09172.1 hypothetical protein DB891_09545 [Flavobacterium laiguense]